MFFTGPAAVRLYDDHVDAVHRYLARRIGPDLAGPIVGETFATAVGTEGPSSDTAEIERSWLLSIASGLLRRHDDVETRRLAAWTASEDVRDDPLLSASPNTGEAAVMRAAALLQPEDRDLLFLTAWEGYPIQTVARVLGLSTGACSSALKRVRRDLRKKATAIAKAAAAGDETGDDTGEADTAPDAGAGVGDVPDTAGERAR